MEPKNIHVVLFTGIPEVAFYRRDVLAAYLMKEGTSLEMVREDMENNPMPIWRCIESGWLRLRMIVNCAFGNFFPYFTKSFCASFSGIKRLIHVFHGCSYRIQYT